MANLKSSKKDIRRIKRRTFRNNQRRTKIDVLTRRLAKEVKEKEKKKTEETLKELYKAIDKAAKNGIYKANKAARMKAKVSKLANSIEAK